LNFEFVFQYPAWFFIFCVAAGLLYAFILYRRTTDFGDSKPWLKRVLFGARALVVSIIAFLLLSPLLKFVTREVEKPLVIILQDNTESLISGKQADFFKNTWPGKLEELKEKLSEQYEVKEYTFDDELKDSFKLDYSGKETDISAALQSINNLYLNRNVGAVILASDGIYNKGASPLYTANELKAAVYTVTLGDTSVKRDLVLARINHNQLAYLNNTFPVEVVVDAKKLAGQNSVLKIERNGQVLGNQNIAINSGAFLQTYTFQLKADQPGVQRYRATVSSVTGEFTTVNNVRDFFIEVIDGRQKVLILAESPHPDVAALRMSLQQNENYEVETGLASTFTGSVKPYSLVIMHQLPGKINQAAKILTELEAQNIPTLFILGNSSSTGVFNTVQPLVQLTGARGTVNDAQAKLNKDFSLFTISEELRRAIPNFEPLQVPYANYKTMPSAAIMLRQKIGNVETDYPLMAFTAVGDRKIGVLLGEGIWRWRLQSFAENQNHGLFNEFVSKLVQYLSIRTEKRNFRIVTKNSFFENEPVTFEAEVYNASYELINTPDVLLNIFDDANRKYPFTFSKTSNAYRLDAGMLRSGDYRYEASVNVSGKQYTAAGKFIVKPVVAEVVNTTADHALLQTLALRNGGESISPENLMTIADKLFKREDVKPVSHSESRLKELINLQWIFFIILILLAAEWLLRKRNGAY